MPNSGRMKKGTYELQKMREIHHEIVRQVILNKSDTEISQNLGVSKVMVRYTRESPIVADKIAVIRGSLDAESIDLVKEVRDLAPVALAILEEFLLDPGHDMKERRMIAQDILDRDGRAPRTHKTEIGEPLLRTKDIEDIKRAAREAARNSGSMVEDAIVVADIPSSIIE